MTLSFPAGLDTKQFLRDYWQRRPLLMRGGVADFTSPITADELAGLALEPEVESRLIVLNRDVYSLRHGPFTVSDLEADDDGPMTLLVQDVDKLVPQVTRLRTLVRFIPHWRFDDVMISFATPGGGVGPHIDAYDVFLLQGEGRRQWSIDERPDASRRLREGSDLALLADFQATSTWELDPGDVLYLPPGVPHNGVALTPGLTFSLGFRAPDAASWLAALASDVSCEPFGDQHRATTKSAGALGESDVGVLRDVLEQRWAALAPGAVLARMLTEPKPHLADLVEPEDGPLPAGPWQRPPAVRALWYEKGRQLFVHGEKIAVPNGAETWAQAYCDTVLDVEPAAGASVTALAGALWRKGYLESPAADG